MKQLKARIRKSKEYWYSQPINETPSMLDIMGKVADGKNTLNRWQKIRNLQTQAKILMFLQQNSITDITSLVEKIETINREYKDLADKINPVERRLETLAAHLEQCEILQQHRAVYNHYVKLNPKIREAYYAKYKTEIDLFKNARDYINAVMNGRTDPVPVKDWQAEQKKLTAYKFTLCEKYYSLQDEIRSVELLRKGADNIMREEAREALTRKHSIEL